MVTVVLDVVAVAGGDDTTAAEASDLDPAGAILDDVLASA